MSKKKKCINTGLLSSYVNTTNLLGRDHTELTKTKQKQKRNRTETIQKQNINKVKLLTTHIKQNVKYFLDVLVVFFLVHV